MTQSQKILHLLSDQKWHSVSEFIDALRIFKYSSRIAEIRERLIQIEAVRGNTLIKGGVQGINYSDDNNHFYYRLVTDPKLIDFDSMELKIPADGQIGMAL